ncbi:hypothetical protein AN644_03750 [Candidatus Epulonipiscium fishelsonii]|nr:hypothetical protein AN644_03750 [Epulopiscium sp. SCG-C06WGA-EpuloA1]
MSRKMKNSGVEWIGKIPAEWEIVKNKYILSDIYSGSTPSTSNFNYYNEEGFPFVSISDMSSVNYVVKTKKYITEEAIKDTNIKLLPKGTILYSIYATIGAISELQIEAAINQAILALTPNSKINKKFYKFNLYTMKSFILSNINSNTQYNLNLEKVKNFYFVLPDFNEQERIANCLDKKCSALDNAIEKIKDTIDEYKKLKQSIITEVVTKGLNPDAETKDSGVEWIGKIPKHWSIKKLKNILTDNLQYGANETGITYNKNLPRYIRITDITLDNKLKDDNKQSLDCNDSNKYILKECDILFARSGTLGKTFLYKSEYGLCAFAGYLIRATINNDNIAKFVFYYTQSYCYNEWQNRIYTKSTIQNIGANKYSILDISLPPKEEQIQIAEYLDKKCADIDAIVSQKQELLKELEDYKKSLIYECVTGKREIYERR